MEGEAVELIAFSDSFVANTEEPFFFAKRAKMKIEGCIAICISLASDWLKPKFNGSKN